MSFWIPLVLIILSVVVLVTVYLSSLGWELLDIDHIYIYPTGYVAIGIIGVSAGFLGFDLLRTESKISGMIGGFLLLSGLQVTLWLLGVRLDFLGNQSTVEETSILRRRLKWKEREYLRLKYEYGRFSQIFHEIEELAPELDWKILQDLSLVLEDPELRSELAPFAKDVLIAAEKFRLETRISGEPSVEARQELIRAISRFRVEMAFWPAL